MLLDQSSQGRDNTLLHSYRYFTLSNQQRTALYSH